MRMKAHSLTGIPIMRVLPSSVLSFMLCGALGLSATHAQTSASPQQAAQATTPASAPTPTEAPSSHSTEGAHRHRAHQDGHGHKNHHDKAEHRKAAERFHEQRFKALDTDQDGHLSRAEFDAEHERMRARRMAAFESADADRDGRLSPAEMKAFHRGMRKDMHESMRGGPR